MLGWNRDRLENKKKKINTFAILVVLMIAVPEIVGHLYFETQKHSPSSSVDAALLLTNRLHSMYVGNDTKCHLVLVNDTTATNVSRASGIQGQYGVYTCT